MKFSKCLVERVEIGDWAKKLSSGQEGMVVRIVNGHGRFVVIQLAPEGPVVAAYEGDFSVQM